MTTKNMLGNLREDVLLYWLHDCLVRKNMSACETDKYFRKGLKLIEYRVTTNLKSCGQLVTVTYCPIPEGLEEGSQAKSTCEAWHYYLNDLPKFVEGLSPQLEGNVDETEED